MTITQYVWQGKKAKISFDLLANPKDMGRLRLCNVVAKHQATLCQWLFILQEDTFLYRDREESLSSTLKDKIWMCNLHYSDANLCFQNSFWKFVLIAWCHYNYSVPQNKEQILGQLIWYNSCICCSNAICYNPQLIQAGMMYVKDIVGMDRELLEVEQLQVKFTDCVNWLEYKGILDAIPKKW